MKVKVHFLPALALVASIAAGCQLQNRDTASSEGRETSPEIEVEKIEDAGQLNVIFILADDHRYDAMGFTGAIPGLETPNMDRMASEGVYIKNAFVSTALCSPSRASILTGQYAHTHTIVDNSAPMPEGLRFFPQYLQKAGYQTAFIGKWHMGNQDDEPQPGFDRWVSFKGQGQYYNPTLNVDGKQVKHSDSTYMTDLLTEYAVNWLDSVDSEKPFFLYLSHKANHAEFYPAKRHAGTYTDLEIEYPPSMFLTATDSSTVEVPPGFQGPEGPVNKQDIPDWVREQRYSWHGVDYMYHGTIVFDDFYRRYLETLLALDESVGRVMEFLTEKGLAENTVVIYMGDNGFGFGEHGLIDKRHMYEESMRVPLLVWAPGMQFQQHELKEMVQNIDIGPTVLELAGVKTPSQMQGMSFAPLLRGENIPWRDKVYYEYYWEYAFPQTPTIFGVRTDRYKYIFNHGVWDINEFYDLQEDPLEVNNLIRSNAHQDTIKSMVNSMWTWLEETDGLQIPLKRIGHKKFDNRYKGTY